MPNLTTTSGDNRKFWEWTATFYDHALTVFGKPYRRTFELTRRDVSGADNVLEVGAGTGLLSREIAPEVDHLVATDYAVAMVDELREHVEEEGLSNVDCARADLYDLDYPDDTFEVVVAGNVLHLVPDLTEALASLRRVLRPGGTLVTPTFCHDETWLSSTASRLFALMGEPMHRRFTTASLREAHEAAGLEVNHSETAPGLIPIGYVASTLPDPSLDHSDN